MYLLTHIALIFFLYPANIVASVSTGHWLPIIFGFALHIGIIFVYMKGLSYHKDQDIIEIIMGKNKIIAVLVLLPVTLYLIGLAIVSIRAISEIITIVYLSKTPLWAVMILFLLIATYMASLGPLALFRTGVLLAILFFPLTVFVLSSAFQNADWHYAFPLTDKSVTSFSFLAGRHFHESGFAFAGAFVFLGFIQKQLPYKPKRILLSSLILLPLFLLSVYLPLLTFGKSTASQFQFPFIMSLDTLEVNWLMFDRITIFFLQSLTTFVMLFIALLMWETVTVINRTIIKVKPGYILFGLCILIFIACLKIPDWENVQQALLWSTYLRTYVMIVLPLTILWLGLSKKKQYT